MPEIKRIKPPAPTTSTDEPEELPQKASAAKQPSSKKQYSLPTEDKKPISDLAQAVILIYGEPKIGKTLTASQFPDNLFMFTEKGGRGTTRREVIIESWEDFKGYVATLRKERLYRTVTIDTIDKLYDFCAASVCEKLGIDDPSEDSWGSWRRIRTEFETEIDRLIATGRGLVMISHTAEKTFRKRTGLEYNKLVPSAGKQASKAAMALADITLYFGYFDETRYMTIAGSDSLEGGTRLAERFWAKNGKRVHSIPAGNNEKEAYANLIRAFNNEQPEECIPEGRPGLTDAPPKKKRN